MFITGLKFDNIGMCNGLELFILIEALLCSLVEGLQVSDFRGRVEEVGESKIKFTNKHTELSTPVTGMVDAQHIETLGLEKTANAITLNSRTQMADMHVLSDVRG